MGAIAVKQSSNDTTRKHKVNEQIPETTGASFFSSPDIAIQRKPSCPCGGGCPRCRDNSSIQTKQLLKDHYSNQIEPLVPSIVHDVLRSPGQPLDPAMRAFMEPRFGHDLSQVRVHTDGKATESALAVNARAYTVGRNVVFAEGQYAPQTNSGRRLLAHELAHTIQQHGSNESIQKLPTNISANSDSAEREAENAAMVVAEGGQNRVALSFSPPMLQRQTSGAGQPLGGCGICFRYLPGGLQTGGIIVHEHIQFIAKLRDQSLLIDEPLVGMGYAKEGLEKILESLGKTEKVDRPKGAEIPDILNPVAEEPGSARKRVEYAEIKPDNEKGKKDGMDAVKRYRARLRTMREFRGADIRPMENLELPPIPLFEPKKPEGCPRQTITVRHWKNGIYLYSCTPSFKDLVKDPACKCADAGKKGEKGKKEGEKKEKKAEKKEKETKGKKENEEKNKKIDGKGGNVGFGISIMSTGGGTANAGVGISIMSSGTGIGTAGAGIIYDSHGTAIGSAGVAAASGSTSTILGGAGAGGAKETNILGAGVAGVGAGERVDVTGGGLASVGTGKDVNVIGGGVTSSGEASNIDATALGASGKGEARDVTGHVTGTAPPDAATGEATAQTGPSDAGVQGGTPAGVSSEVGAEGTGGGTGSKLPPAPNTSEFKSAQSEAQQAEKALATATPEQANLLHWLADRSPGGMKPVPNAAWINNFMTVTKDLTQEQVERLKEVEWEPAYNITLQEMKDRFAAALKGGVTATEVVKGKDTTSKVEDKPPEKVKQKETEKAEKRKIQSPKPSVRADLIADLAKHLLAFDFKTLEDKEFWIPVPEKENANFSSYLYFKMDGEAYGADVFVTSVNREKGKTYVTIGDSQYVIRRSDGRVFVSHLRGRKFVIIKRTEPTK